MLSSAGCKLRLLQTGMCSTEHKARSAKLPAQQQQQQTPLSKRQMPGEVTTAMYAACMHSNKQWLTQGVPATRLTTRTLRNPQLDTSTPAATPFTDTTCNIHKLKIHSI